MSIHDTAKWIQLVGDVKWNQANNCPSIQKCVRMRKISSITSATIDATNLENINLQLDIVVRGMGIDTGFCTIQYSIDDGSTYKTILTYTEADNQIVYYNVSTNLTDASNSNIIKLQVGTLDGGRCFLNNVILRGDAPPTPMPTTTPSTNPTVNPSTTPSNTPTTAIPTDNPSTTPTEYPSTTPTYNPSTTPTDTPSETPTKNPSVTPTGDPSTTPTAATPTDNPTTASPTSSAPTTSMPTTQTPTTSNPTTSSPTTAHPTTSSPLTSTPTTSNPTTNVPTTTNPTTSPVTVSPTSSSITSNPTTSSPVTVSPTSSIPTTNNPTTISPTTSQPTKPPITTMPITSSPSTSTTGQPSVNPTTISPTPTNPITSTPTSSRPTTSIPTTNAPSTSQPITVSPTISIPTTSVATTNPTTSVPTTSNPTTNMPTTISPTPSNPITSNPTTVSPTTTIPTTSAPITNPPTVNPITASPTPSMPTTNAPTTSNPTTSNPTTKQPTASNPITSTPTTNIPITNTPTTNTPTTNPITSTPTTAYHTTSNPTAVNPTTTAPTTNESTNSSPTTDQLTTLSPTTSNPTTNIPITNTPTTTYHTTNPTTTAPTTSNPTTTAPTTSNPTTTAPTTNESTTNSPTTDQLTTLSPTTSSPTTNIPTTSGESDDEDIQKSQLKLKSSDGECNFTCWECLQQVDITGHGSSAWDLLFMSSNETNCTCPNKQGTISNDNETINVGENDPAFRLEIEKYVLDENEQGENDDEGIRYGLRVNVLYWNSIPQTCTISYSVNQNEFFGIQAQNILTISFTVCSLSPEKLVLDAIIQRQLEYRQWFADLFNISNMQVNATIEIGDFCDEETRRRNLLQNSGSDEEVTVVIIFADANDAQAAEDNACDEVRAQNPNIPQDKCETKVNTKDEIEGGIEQDDVYETNDENNDSYIAIIIIVVVSFTIVLLTLAYCFFSYRKRQKKKRLKEEYEKVRKQSNTNSSLDGRVTTGRKNTHERIQSCVISTNTAVNTSNHQKLQSKVVIIPDFKIANSNEIKHLKCLQSIEIELNATIRLNDMPSLPCEQQGKLEEKKEDGEIEIIVQQNTPESDIESQDELHKLINTDEIDPNAANEIKQEDLIIDKKIGNGHFGEVYKAIWEGNLVVLKQLKSLNDEKEFELNDKEFELKREIILSTSLPPHQNLVEVFGYVNSPSFGIVMRYMAGDSVEKYVYRQYKTETDCIPSIMELLIILTKSACGFKFLHEYGLIHRDIACRNILLGKIDNNNVDLLTEVRVSDFGLSRQLQNKNDSQKSKSNFGPIKWMAPESIKEKKYSKSSDVYMFGITMWEIFYGIEPYSNENNNNYTNNIPNLCIDIVNNNKRPLIQIENNPNGKYKHIQMSNLYKRLMELCWSQNVHDRPTFQKIISILTKIEGNPIQSNEFWD